MKAVYLILIIWMPNQLVFSQPGCGLTCINIKGWKLAGKMVKVEIGLLSNGKRLRGFKVNGKDSLVSFGHTTASMYCSLKSGKKVIKLIIDSLKCNEYYSFILSDLLVKTIDLIPSETASERGCSNRRSKLLIARRGN